MKLVYPSILSLSFLIGSGSMLHNLAHGSAELLVAYLIIVVTVYLCYNLRGDIHFLSICLLVKAVEERSELVSVYVAITVFVEQIKGDAEVLLCQ